MPTLGNVVNYGCYKGGKKLNSVQYCHNCSGDNIRWQFEVLDDQRQVMGHVEVTLSCKGLNMNESQQAAEMRRLAQVEVDRIEQ